MSKQAHTKREEIPSPKSQAKDLAAVHPSTGSLPRAATATSHATAASGQIPTQEQIAVRAYQLWEAHGRCAGTEREDWFEAERLLRAKA